ncbi:MAG: carbohydrate kinase [Burkholderiaceae bacterium]|nr:carbohydrate kinase [Burkholderiaceae bacterium]
MPPPPTPHDPLLLALDAGTQGVRAIVFDAGGNPRAASRIALAPAFVAPQPGWAEQDPQVYWDALVAAVQGLWRAGAVRPGELAAVALTTQRGTVVCADESGAPLRPAIVWPDSRLARDLPPLGPMWGSALRLAGAHGLVRRLQTQAEVNWIAAHEPALWARAARVGLLSAWLSERLVGQWVDSIGCQVGYLPFDYRRLRWAGAASWRWRALAVRAGQLPRLVPPASALGTLTAPAAAALGLPRGLPVIAAAADKACEVLACGALAPDAAHLSLGTAAAINTTQPRYLEVQRLLPAYPAALPGHWNTEVHLPRGFWLVSWFRDQFGAEECARAAALGVAPESLFDALLAATPPGSDGLVLQPHWSPGLRDPGPEARGAIVGFTDQHGRAHLYRAIVEGVLFALRGGRERIERRLGRRLTALHLSGGGARSDAVAQIAADIFGLPAQRPQCEDASALGAAMLAAAGLGLHAGVPAAVRAMARAGKVSEPDPAAVRVCDEVWHERVRPLYPRLRPLLRRWHEVAGQGR